MSRIVVSHALGADENSVWFPYLRSQLQPLGHTVEVPRLPDADVPHLVPWRTALAAQALAAPASDTVLVGHSIGAVNVLRVLERHDVDRHDVFAGAVLVAAPVHEVGYDALAEFFAEPFDWARIRRAAGRFRALVAADDPVLTPDPLEHVADLVVQLGATATVKPTGGHLGAAPDEQIELPEVVRLTLEILETSN